MNEEISALMDGELSEQELNRLLQALPHKPELRRTWDEYHELGDALRGCTAAAPGFGDRFAARLAAEPTILAPQLAPRRAAIGGPWLAAAAVAAGVAFVGWVAWPTATPETPIAVAPARTVIAAQPAAVPLHGSLRDYLLAHQAYSPAGGMQGVVPYARTVASADEARQ
jgi:sigma-E factor negative regulatory protein RseA